MKRAPRNQPLIRLLTQAYRYNNTEGTASIEVEYPNQWPTIFKAERLGLVTEYTNGCNLTPKGRQFMATHNSQEGAA